MELSDEELALIPKAMLAGILMGFSLPLIQLWPYFAVLTLGLGALALYFAARMIWLSCRG